MHTEASRNCFAFLELFLQIRCMLPFTVYSMMEKYCFGRPRLHRFAYESIILMSSSCPLKLVSLVDITRR